MGDGRLSISVFVWTQEGNPHGYGFVETLTLADALVVVSVPLKHTETFNFLLVDHTCRTVAERFGKVLWMRCAFNSDKELSAECRVQWLSAGDGHARERVDMPFRVA